MSARLESETEIKKEKFAETVVIYVRVTDRNGRLIFHARYGNCYEGPNANTAHAEYFILVDEEFRQAVKYSKRSYGKKYYYV